VQLPNTCTRVLRVLLYLKCYAIIGHYYLEIFTESTSPPYIKKHSNDLILYVWQGDLPGTGVDGKFIQISIPRVIIQQRWHSSLDSVASVLRVSPDTAAEIHTHDGHLQKEENGERRVLIMYIKQSYVRIWGFVMQIYYRGEFSLQEGAKGFKMSVSAVSTTCISKTE